MSSRETVSMERLAWPEIDAALSDGTRTAIVAVGAIEQHGPHLPLAVDAIDGDELARRIARELGDALAAPTIRPGCSEHHLAFPGTISLPPETMRDVIRAYCRSLAHHGFEHVVLLPTHGGNFEPVESVAHEIEAEIDASVIALADLDEHMRLQNEGLRAAGIDYEEPVIHAGAVETATMLAAEDGGLRSTRLEAGHEGEVSTERLLAEGFREITESGVLGDPREATAEAGEEIYAALVEAFVARIEAAREAGEAAEAAEE